jgi:peptidoglycan lytic transglycosylase
MKSMLVAAVATAFAVSCLVSKQAVAADGASGQSGIASVYSNKSSSSSRTASGKKLNPAALTAAHRTLPFGTNVLVTNKKNGRSVIVTINDRGPFRRGRVIDVTPAAARILGFSGLARVALRVVPEPQPESVVSQAEVRKP